MTDEMLDFCSDFFFFWYLYNAFDSLFDALFLLSNKGWDVKIKSAVGGKWANTLAPIEWEYINMQFISNIFDIRD